MKLTFLFIMILAGCAARKPIVARNDTPAISRDEVDNAKLQASSILRALPVYTDDPLSQFEAAEIEAVEHDILAIEDDDDPARLVARVATLKLDWDSLVGLDEILQKEHLI